MMASPRLALTGLFIIPVAIFLALSARRMTTSPHPDPQDGLRPRPRWTPRPAETPLEAPLEAPQETSRQTPGAVAPSAPPTSAPAAPASGDDVAARPRAAPRSPTRSIPGVDAAGLLDALARIGLECSAASYDGGGVTWTCAADAARARYLVVVHGDDTSSITWLRATVTLAGSDFLAARFLAGVAGLDYSGAEPARAVDWVNRTIATEGSATIASVRFTLSGAPGARTLEMSGEGLRR
jgi:hypothetical protein